MNALKITILTFILSGCATFDPVQDAMDAGCEPRRISTDHKGKRASIECFDPRRIWQ